MSEEKQKWEYKRYKKKGQPIGEIKLKEYGDGGWELVDTNIKQRKHTDNTYYYFFKRPKLNNQ